MIIQSQLYNKKLAISKCRYLVVQQRSMLKYLLRNSKYFCDIYQTVEAGKAKISKFQSRNFSDHLRLKIAAGSGGNGCESFYTDKRIRRGAPDGGCGGRGGDIILQAHQSLFDLSHLRRRTIQGNDGRSGGPRGKEGKNGGKTMIRVPCGTLVYQIQITENIDENNIEKVQKKIFLSDLSKNSQNFIVAKGGLNGKGNKNYPHLNQEMKFGKQGARKIIYLELKTLADVGLVGFPNIGKSTFLAAASRALPKIANYQFTTLKPSVGYVKFVDDFKFTIADIPGIIQGAHENKGLGLEFLKHIERTKILLIMLDITSNDPYNQLTMLQKQLTEYKKDLFAEKSKIVVFNKRDCHPRSQELFQMYRKKIKYPCFLISAKQGDNVGDVLVSARNCLEQLSKKEEQQMLKKAID